MLNSLALPGGHVGAAVGVEEGVMMGVAVKVGVGVLVAGVAGSILFVAAWPAKAHAYADGAA